MKYCILFEKLFNANVKTGIDLFNAVTEIYSYSYTNLSLILINIWYFWKGEYWYCY